MTTQEPEASIDQTIAAAVNARVEAEVLRSLSGDEVLGKLVVAALQAPVEVPDPVRHHRKIEVPFLPHIIAKSIREATRTAVAELLVEMNSEIEDLCRKEIKRLAPTLAKAMAGSLTKAADSEYRLRVELKLPGQDY